MGLKLHCIWNFIKSHKLISLLIFVSFISSIRIFFIPLGGDALTYTKIAKNIIFHGKYFLDGKPSTITPSVPFIIALFYTKFSPIIGFTLAKFVNYIFLLIGLKYCFLFLKNIKLDIEVIWVILLLTIVNGNFVLWSIRLYPESILFCFFWIFIYFASKNIKRPYGILYLLLSFVFLVLTRYVYAVLGILVLFEVLQYLKTLPQNKRNSIIRKLTFFSVLCILPLLFWFKYVFNLEKEVDTGLSYFTRFKNNEILYNIKAGLGLIKHNNVDNINGIPAFISLFVPKTGLRSWPISLILLLAFSIGFIPKLKVPGFRKLFIAILLVMFGLIFAGTGFSRYWLLMLPGFLLGFYLFLKQFKFEDKLFLVLGKIVAVIYVVNEIRLDIFVLDKL